MEKVQAWQAYVVGIIGIVVILVRAVPQIFGPVGRYVEAWTDRRQRVQRHTTAAEVRDLQTSVARLEEALADLRARATEHAAWDRDMYRELVKAGIDVQPPPPLF